MTSRFAATLALVVGCGGGTSAPQAGPVDKTQPHAFKRDFGKAGSWQFDYQQRMTMGKDALEASGVLRVDSSGDHTAIATLDASMTVSGHSEKVPATTFQLAEDGSAPKTVDGDESRALTDLLMPLPHKPLRVGESETTTYTMPANLGAVTSISGPLTLELTGYDTVGGRRCAEITTTLRVDDKSNGAKMTIDGTSCLDVGDALVVKSKLDIDMELAGSSTTPAMKFAGVLTLARK